MNVSWSIGEGVIKYRLTTASPRKATVKQARSAAGGSCDPAFSGLTACRLVRAGTATLPENRVVRPSTAEPRLLVLNTVDVCRVKALAQIFFGIIELCVKNATASADESESVIEGCSRAVSSANSG
jgi:hypothetical protein